MRDDHLRARDETRSAGIAPAVRRREGILVVEFAGDLDVFVEAELRRTLAGLTDAGVPVCLDLRAVPFIDSTALAVLLWARRCLRDRGAPLVLAGVQPAVVVALDQAGLGTRLQRFGSAEEAALAIAPDA